MDLIINDNLSIFQEFGITDDFVHEAYSNPDCTERLLNNVSLYIKSFKSIDKKKVLLLICTQVNNGNELFVFSYWVPDEYQINKVNLVDFLELFANQFGLKIKIGNDEGYFLRISQKLISGKLTNPFSLVNIQAPEQLPCKCFLFTSESQIGKLNSISFYYSFALNTGKYLFWLNSVPTIKMNVKFGWYDFVRNNFIDLLQPNGQTKIKIQKQINTEHLKPDSNKSLTTIEVPVIYKNQFTHVLNQINNLNDDEKILFSLSLESPKCLFCQSTNISKEHIFPIWLRPYLKETTFRGTNFSNFGDETLNSIFESATTKGKKESSHGYTTKLVCVDCNTGWLSLLENEIKGILIDGGKLINSISERIDPIKANKLSRWLIIKALLLSNKLSSNIHKIKTSVFEDLKAGKINNGFLVEATTTENSKFNFHVGKGLLYQELLKLDKIPIAKGKQMTSNFFSCSIQLNHLLFRVSFLDFGTAVFFNRETILKKTFILFPLGTIVPHRRIENDENYWTNMVHNNLEIDLFAINGILLVEKKNP